MSPLRQPALPLVPPLPPTLPAAHLPRREKELAAVKVPKESIDSLAAHFELDRKRAERVLREHGGDVRLAVDALLAV